MAKATACYRWAEDAAVHVSVHTDEGFPDAVAEVTASCRRLLREVAVDINALLEVEDEDAEVDQG